MNNNRRLLLSFGAFLLVLTGMLWSEQQASCGTIIIPLELAPDITTFKQMISGCSMEWLKRNTLLDFLFLTTYTATLFYAFKALAGSMAKYAWFTLLPALFDCIENVLLIRFLYADESTVSSSVFSVYYMCVHIKFVLLAVILIALLVLVLKKLFGRLSAN